ncbi:MAG: aldehyde dehydrogenase family protein [Magnetococcales bacterium]|nr:aldehyde dehydrogenase family protein [Magnetococcales bacterium]
MKRAYIGGEWVETDRLLKVINPYDDSLVAEVALCGEAEIERAIALAYESLEEVRQLAPYQRADALIKVRDGITARSEEFAQTLSKENGKTIAESRLEVARAAATFDIAAGEATRISGEIMELGINAMGAGRRGMVRRYPIGVVSAIAPFNFPLNLAIHKIAPAMAAGCPVLLKPASKTPLSSLMMAEEIEKSGWPKKAFSLLPSDRKSGQMLVEDERIKLLSFTGSPEVGWQMKRDAGKKKVVLELGGNAGLIIDRDVRDWDWLIQRAVLGAFYQCGQVCISVQRIFVHEEVMGEFRSRFKAAAEALKAGDPLATETTLGPIINGSNRDRLQKWIADALVSGAQLVTGNSLADVGGGNTLNATVLEAADRDSQVVCEEAFGPVVTLFPVRSMEEAFQLANDSRYGLQCGIFTNDFNTVMKAMDVLEVGGVIHNDVPSFRVDSMPYGGVKDSGLGREGVRYAMEDMLEHRVLVHHVP